MSVHWPIIRRCLFSPLRTAAVDDRRSYKAGELIVAAMHVAAAIRASCRTPTVGVMIPSSGAFPIAALAGWMLGKVVVPLNFLLKPGELQYVIDDCGTDTVVTVGPMLEHLGTPPKVGQWIKMDELSFKGLPRPVWPRSAADDDLAVLLYTSGTSGKPKGVMLTHGNLTANVRQVTDWIDFLPSDSLLGVLPQFHSFGLTVLTLLPLMVGRKTIYSARFIPSRIVKLIREHRPTILVAIPSMYNALMTVKDAGPDDFRSLRVVVSGGEPLSEAVFNAFRERFGITINEGYGLTETSPVTNWCRPDEWRPRSVGRPLPRVVQRIVDPASGKEVSPGAEGEIQIAGPNVMKGYYKLAEQTREVFTPDGFFRTGDIGRFDSDGHLYITGRIKEMLIVGGENVFPREIEEVLNQHPSVSASAVIGAHDPMRGELPFAFVEVAEGAEFHEKQLLAWCREHLAGYKVPTSVVRVEVLPRNPTGKIMRRELKNLLPAH